MTRITRSAAQALAVPAAGSPKTFLVRRPGGLLWLLLLWQERACQRHQLAEMSDHLLKDMGITRASAEHESAKPFWRP